jgi:hypothetical protein
MHQARILVNHLAAAEEIIRRKANSLTATNLTRTDASLKQASVIRRSVLFLACRKQPGANPTPRSGRMPREDDHDDTPKQQ